jgi:hypothetical protein
LNPNHLRPLHVEDDFLGHPNGLVPTESASRLLIVFVIMTNQFGRINAFNEMCAGLKD